MSTKLLGHQNTGRLGEDIACQYLVDKGYKIILRNYTKPWGEIDIIAKSPDKILVFVEVKTMRQLYQSTVDNPVNNLATNPASFNDSDNDSDNNNDNIAELMPEENLTVAKYRRLCRSAEAFSRRFRGLIDEEKGWRIDLITITLTNNQDSCVLKHYQNISR